MLVAERRGAQRGVYRLEQSEFSHFADMRVIKDDQVIVARRLSDRSRFESGKRLNIPDDFNIGSQAGECCARRLERRGGSGVIPGEPFQLHPHAHKIIGQNVIVRPPSTTSVWPVM